MFDVRPNLVKYPISAIIVIIIHIQRPGHWSPALFFDLDDADCVFYTSYHMVPHFDASKKTFLRASIIPRLCKRIEHGIGIAMPVTTFRSSLSVGFYDCLKLLLASSPETFFYPSCKCF